MCDSTAGQGADKLDHDIQTATRRNGVFGVGADGCQVDLCLLHASGEGIVL